MKGSLWSLTAQHQALKVKQDCVLAPTLFGVFYAFLLNQDFGDAKEGIYLGTRSDGKLFNLSRLRAKSKVQMKCLYDFLLADDTAINGHSDVELQNRFSKACQDFGLTIRLKKTQIMEVARGLTSQYYNLGA